MKSKKKNSHAQAMVRMRNKKYGKDWVKKTAKKASEVRKAKVAARKNK